MKYYVNVNAARGGNGSKETPEKGNKATFVPTGSTADTYSVWAVMYNDGCYGPKVEVTYTIKEIPAEPTVENAEICYGEANKNVTATGVGTVNWYSDASKMVSIQKGSNGYLSKRCGNFFAHMMANYGRL